MEVLLSKVTQQAMNYAIRSGIGLTGGFALQQCARLLKTKKGTERQELADLQRRLDSKIRIISPAIDMIELISARGNTSLETAVALTSSLRSDIQDLGVRIANAVTAEELSRKGSSKAKSQAQRENELKLVVTDMKTLLERIEDAVPLINLAITTSGASLSTTLPTTVSPSRLLQASTFLSAADANYACSLDTHVLVGPTFTLSLYMLFAGYSSRVQDTETLRSTTWKEVIHKARVKLIRRPLESIGRIPETSKAAEHAANHRPHEFGSDVPHSIPSDRRADEFAYSLLLIEDLDDGRVHDDEGEPQPGRFDDVALAGIREVLPIHEIAKIFYADTGKILNIGNDGEANSPVLLLKRDVNAIPPRRMMSRTTEGEDDWNAGEVRPNTETILEASAHDDTSEVEAQFYGEVESAGQLNEKRHTEKHSLGLPAGLDPEWLAFEVYNEDPDSDSASDSDLTEIPSSSASHQEASGEALASAISRLRLGSTPLPSSSDTGSPSPLGQAAPPVPLSFGPVRTSLSLLEMLIRLGSLQQFQQASHLTINDELLNFFLQESSTTGAGDDDTRKRIRMNARHRLGFDPYDESPIKRRGEEYMSSGQQGYDDNAESDWGGSQRAWSPRAGYTPSSPLSSSLHNQNQSSHARTNLSDRAATPDRKVEAQSPSTLSQRRNSVVTPSRRSKPRQSALRDEGSKNGDKKSSPLAKTQPESSEG